MSVLISGSTTFHRKEVDPMTLRVIGGALSAIAKEMGITIFRTAFNPIIREAEDLGAGLYDAEGREIAESETTAMHCGSIGWYIRGICRRHGSTISRGDVFLHNYPYNGATHTADVCVAIPVFAGDQLVAWAAGTAHLADLGGGSAGLNTDAFDCYAEGKQYDALRIESGGVRNQELWRHIFENVRTPISNEGDVEALYTAARLGEQRFLRLCDKYGVDIVMSAANDWMDHCEKLLRAEIATIEDGEYVAPVQWMDDDAVHRGKPLNINVKVIKKGTDIIVDLTGSHPEVESAVNAPFEGSTQIAAFFAIRTIFLDSARHEGFIPHNEGMFRPITTIAPEGSLFNPRWPRATYARFCACNIACDSIFLALAAAAPDRVVAGSGAEVHVIAFSGFDAAHSRYWVYVQLNESSWGGRKGKDGMDSIGCLMENIRNLPVEEEELSYPVRIERYELRDDVPPGAGQWRGGMGIVRRTRFLTSGTVTSEAERQFDPPRGLFGGGRGHVAHTIVNPGRPEEARLPSKFTSHRMEPGEAIEFRTACGAGYGNPLLRDPRAVADDALDGLISREQATELYGVVLDLACQVDQTETDRNRLARANEPFASD